MSIWLNQLRNAYHRNEGYNLVIESHPIRTVSKIAPIMRYQMRLRLQTPTGIFEADYFIHELYWDLNLAAAIGSWMLTQTIAAARVTHQTYHCHLGVGTLADPMFPCRIEQVLRNLPALKSSLAIDVRSETLINATVEHTVRNLSELGIAVYLDHIGGDRASQHLCSNPFSGFKVSAEMTALATEKHTFYWWLENQMDFAMKVGYQVIVEGVDTPEHYGLVCKLQNQFPSKNIWIQGDYISSPDAPWMSHTLECP